MRVSFNLAPDQQHRQVYRDGHEATTHRHPRRLVTIQPAGTGDRAEVLETTALQSDFVFAGMQTFGYGCMLQGRCRQQVTTLHWCDAPTPLGSRPVKKSSEGGLSASAAGRTLREAVVQIQGYHSCSFPWGVPTHP
jgi:hypothetical protein